MPQFIGEVKMLANHHIQERADPKKGPAPAGIVSDMWLVGEDGVVVNKSGLDCHYTIYLNA